MEIKTAESYRNEMMQTAEYLRTKKKILFLTTSNRWRGEHGGEKPKSTQLAEKIAELVGENDVEIVDVPTLTIYPCEGNISTARGNRCGLQESQIIDREKNPSGYHRCFASINNPDDELWKVSKPLLEADCVVFSARCGGVSSTHSIKNSWNA